MRLTGRSSGDGRLPKRAQLVPYPGPIPVPSRDAGGIPSQDAPATPYPAPSEG